MSVSNTKENIFTRFGSWISKVWHSISNFFKPDNIENVPVSSLSEYLRKHLQFIDNIIKNYKPGQKGGISFDAPKISNTSKTQKATEPTKVQTKTEEKVVEKKSPSTKKPEPKSEQYGDLDKFTKILSGNTMKKDGPSRDDE